MNTCSIPEALDEIRSGRMIILVDNEDRENEGDLIIAAEHCTPEVINFMITNGRGLVCVAMTQRRLDDLGLKLMCPENSDKFCTRSPSLSTPRRARPQAYPPPTARTP
jgi:3,4-dihydroxy 2-butanone 4-phosphate synthase/GTP cyclohydrolase II